jgi:hypothetical protein
MTTTTEYREYAQECTRWAAQARSEAMRTAFLDMARQWMEAALRVQGVIPPDVTDRRAQPDARH